MKPLKKILADLESTGIGVKISKATKAVESKILTAFEKGLSSYYRKESKPQTEEVKDKGNRPGKTKS